MIPERDATSLQVVSALLRSNHRSASIRDSQTVRLYRERNPTSPVYRKPVPSFSFGIEARLEGCRADDPVACIASLISG
jgi:hypothetical protein